MRHKFMFPWHYPPDPLDPLPPPDPDPIPARGIPRDPQPRATCEFCECTLTSDGEVLKLSEKAKAWRDRKEPKQLEASAEKIAELEKDNAKLRADIAALTQGPKKSRVDLPV